MAETIIDIHELTKSYGRTQVLRGVESAGAARRDRGPDGHQWLRQEHADQMPARPAACRRGHGQPAGQRCWDLSPAAKERLGYVPQVVYLYGWMKVRHVIAYTASFYENWDSAWADDLAHRWRMPLDARVQTLSTGQLQAVALVLALGHKPDLLILDEPVASLDPSRGAISLRSLMTLTADASRTVLFSTHISSDLERVATHVAILHEGRIAYFAELDELKDSVKRLRLSGSRDFPRDFSVPGGAAAEGRRRPAPWPRCRTSRPSCSTNCAIAGRPTCASKI